MDSADDQQLPVPPPFMFGCGECTKLLRRFSAKVSADGGCFSEQVALAKHIAEKHPDDVPEPHTRDCDQCPTYAKRPDTADSWAEHRARSLFLPQAIARLM
ncbi:hypothetical protein GCM10022403_018270 [Streptomyces coacervatus]|uniref:Uncharacterized protein n=1 Tax=Streptomyces coacervatus TaxID=647381 RepID=A0ABP7H6P3_9ACTN|nr:hypothetical protein [Streptomyces coacervatus]MDF2271553.1 hypothetical protein [Streptomyces coacervatus]